MDSKICKLFDPSNERHVKWLKDIHVTVKTNPKKVLDVICDNPMNVDASPKTISGEWIHIHFGLCVRYTQAIMEKTACLPS